MKSRGMWTRRKDLESPFSALQAKTPLNPCELGMVRNADLTFDNRIYLTSTTKPYFTRPGVSDGIGDGE